MNIPISLRTRGFRLFAGAQFVSLGGWWAEYIAKTMIVYRDGGLQGLFLATQLTVLAQSIAAVWGGRLVDKFSCRSAMLWTQRLLMAEALTLCVLQGMGILNSGVLYALMAFASLVGGVNASAEGAMVRAILQDEHVYEDGLWVNSIVINVAGAMGSLLGGTFLNPQWAMWLFAFNAASYLPVLILLPRLKVSMVEQAEKASLLPALRYIRGHRDVRWALFIYSGAVICCSNGGVMQPLVADKLLGNAHAYAMLLGANCVGNLLPALLKLRRKKKEKTKATMNRLFMGAVLYAGLGVLYGASSWVLLTMVALAGACCGISIVNVTSTALVMSGKDRALDGRLQGIYLGILKGGVSLSCMLARGGVAFYGVRFVALGGPLLLTCFIFTCWVTYNRRRQRHELS